MKKMDLSKVLVVAISLLLAVISPLKSVNGHTSTAQNRNPTTVLPSEPEQDEVNSIPDSTGIVLDEKNDTSRAQTTLRPVLLEAEGPKNSSSTSRVSLSNNGTGILETDLLDSETNSTLRDKRGYSAGANKYGQNAGLAALNEIDKNKRIAQWSAENAVAAAVGRSYLNDLRATEEASAGYRFPVTKNQVNEAFKAVRGQQHAGKISAALAAANLLRYEQGRRYGHDNFLHSPYSSAGSHLSKPSNLNHVPYYVEIPDEISSAHHTFRNRNRRPLGETHHVRRPNTLYPQRPHQAYHGETYDSPSHTTEDEYSQQTNQPGQRPHHRVKQSRPPHTSPNFPQRFPGLHGPVQLPTRFPQHISHTVEHPDIQLPRQVPQAPEHPVFPLRRPGQALLRHPHPPIRKPLLLSPPFHNGRPPIRQAHSFTNHVGPSYEESLQEESDDNDDYDDNDGESLKEPVNSPRPSSPFPPGIGFKHPPIPKPGVDFPAHPPNFIRKLPQQLDHPPPNYRPFSSPTNPHPPVPRLPQFNRLHHKSHNHLSQPLQSHQDDLHFVRQEATGRPGPPYHIQTFNHAHSPSPNNFKHEEREPGRLPFLPVINFRGVITHASRGTDAGGQQEKHHNQYDAFDPPFKPSPTDTLLNSQEELYKGNHNEHEIEENPVHNFDYKEGIPPTQHSDQYDYEEFPLLNQEAGQDDVEYSKRGHQNDGGSDSEATDGKEQHDREDDNDEPANNSNVDFESGLDRRNHNINDTTEKSSTTQSIINDRTNSNMNYRSPFN